MSIEPRFSLEPAYTHGQASRTAIVYCNLGTPDAPTAAALRRYLAEFLSDPRVVEIPRVLWLLILHGIILRVRPAKSALKYASIWTDEGSPLAVHSRRQAALLGGYLGEAGHRVSVALAMRYGEPSVGSVVRELRERNLTRLLVLPLYPQYSASTTATVFQEAFAAIGAMRNQPAVRTVKHFHDDEGYIKASAQAINDYWFKHGRGDHLVLSFHGVPRRTLDLGDPYHCECLKTGRLIAEQIGLKPDFYSVTFQSRFGRAEWLKPYTSEVIKGLAKKKVGRVDVACPGFVSDCLETLEEIAIEAKGDFLTHGGKELHYIPCLNERDDWMHALTDIALKNLLGWNNTATVENLQAAKQRALQLGAKQ